jgi:hypothetical protein
MEQEWLFYCLQGVAAPALWLPPVGGRRPIHSLFSMFNSPLSNPARLRMFVYWVSFPGAPSSSLSWSPGCAVPRGLTRRQDGKGGLQPRGAELWDDSVWSSPSPTSHYHEGVVYRGKRSHRQRAHQVLERDQEMEMQEMGVSDTAWESWLHPQEPCLEPCGPVLPEPI